MIDCDEGPRNAEEKLTFLLALGFFAGEEGAAACLSTMAREEAAELDDSAVTRAVYAVERQVAEMESSWPIEEIQIWIYALIFSNEEQQEVWETLARSKGLEPPTF